jgi:capsular exopolysaccharide synthesis family protein
MNTPTSFDHEEEHSARTPGTSVAPVYSRGSAAYGVPYYGGAQYGGRAEEESALGSLSFSRMLCVLRRKWWLVLLACAIALGGVALYLRLTPPIYEASATIELSVRRPRILNQQGAVIEDGGVASQSDEVFNTRLQKFQSNANFDLAAAKYRQMYPKVQDEADLRGELMAGAKFALLRRTRLVRVAYRHRDPEEAMRRVAALAAAAETSAAQENRAASDSAVAWLETQVSAQRKDLEKADQAVLAFRSANMIDAMANQRKTVEESLLSFNRDLVKLESEEAMARDFLNTMTSFEADPANIGKMPATAPRVDEIRVVHEKWMAAAAERDTMLARYTPRHPEIQARDKTVAVLHGQTVDAIRRSKDTAASNLALLQKQVESLRERKAEQSKLSVELEQRIIEAGTRLRALEREREAADASYRGVLNRIEEARLAADENTANVKIIEQPRLPDADKPVWPRKLPLGALGLMIGCMGGFVLALLVDKLEDHIVSPLDIERDIGLPLIGSIPHLDNVGKPEPVALASINDKLSPFAEAFAGMCASLNSARYRDATAVLVVSSSMPGEGKTVVCANLAATCALHGQRVLLVDFDLRRPRMGTLFRMPPDKPSLLDVLSGADDCPWDLLPFETLCPGLHVVATRPARGRSPADVMGGARVRDFLAWARTNYERIILDAPPVGIVSDAVVLAGFADSVIIVTRLNKSRKRATVYTAGRFLELGIQNVLTVANDVDFRRGHHTYGRSYRYHYKAYAQSHS